MKKRAILKQRLMLVLIALFSVNLTACNKTQEKFIEVGIGNDRGSNSSNSIVTRLWDEFYTGIKASTKRAKTQNIEVFYGHFFVDSRLQNQTENFKFDLNQKLEFRLIRYVYPSDDDAFYSRFEKTEDILVLRETMEFFFSEEFHFAKNSFIDTIEVKDLIKDYKEHGVIEYGFDITPIEDEPIKIFINDEPVYSGNYIRSYGRCIYYKIDDQSRISFIEQEEEKEENVNV